MRMSICGTKNPAAPISAAIQTFSALWRMQYQIMMTIGTIVVVASAMHMQMMDNVLTISKTSCSGEFCPVPDVI
jgi:hypothetical protein